MALSDVKPRLFTLTIAGTARAFAVEAELTGMHDVVPITSGATGGDVHAYMVTGRKPAMKIRMKEATVAFLQQAMSISGEIPLDVGTQLPTVAIKLVPFGDTNDLRAITLHAAAFTEFRPGRFGPEGDWDFEVTVVACRTAGGLVWGFGDLS